MNELFYGDNLTILKGMPKHCVDLIYLDPPFNSKQNYNLMYKTMTGKPVPEQAEAFCDTWEMDAQKEALARNMPETMRQHGIDDYYIEFWNLWIKALQNTQPHLLAYLIYMVERLIWMKSILRPSGSIFLHCDPTASHYIKIMMDGIFGHSNFKNEIIWKRTTAHSDAKRGFGSIHDVILFYSASNKFTWNPVYQPYSEEYINTRYKRADSNGRRWMDDNITAKGLSGGGYEYEYKGASNLWRVPLEKMQELDKQGKLYFTGKGGIRIKRYLDEMKGVPIGDVWTDINPLNSQAKNRLGYPTQKPIELLKRIIEASTNPGDIVFDPFCGCGTSIYAAIELEREWKGCDIAILAVKLIKEVLLEKYRLAEGTNFVVKGIPVSVEQAELLSKTDSFQFQHWVVERAGGFPTQQKSSDRGIDGRLYFECGKNLQEMVISVKGGHIKPADIRDLRGVLEREENAALAGFLSLKEPTKAMREEASRAGVYEYAGVQYPRIQLLTVEDLLERHMTFQTPTRVGTKISTGQGVLAL